MFQSASCPRRSSFPSFQPPLSLQSLSRSLYLSFSLSLHRCPDPYDPGGPPRSHGHRRLPHVGSALSPSPAPRRESGQCDSPGYPGSGLLPGGCARAPGAAGWSPRDARSWALGSLAARVGSSRGCRAATRPGGGRGDGESRREGGGQKAGGSRRASERAKERARPAPPVTHPRSLPASSPLRSFFPPTRGPAHLTCCSL